MRHVMPITKPNPALIRVDQGPFLDFLEKQLQNLMAGLGDKKPQPE